MSQRNWSREETLVALNIYCRNAFGRLHKGNPEIVEAAAALGRTPSALAMKCCNLAGFDEAQRARGVRGLSKGSKLDEQIWTEFTDNPEDVAFEAEAALAHAMDRELRVANDVQWEEVDGIDRVSQTKARVNQQFFRAMILAGYRAQCAICGLPVRSLLVASHIIPWSIDKSLRMNPTNGICLCALHDRAFDKGLIGVESDYTVTIHSRLAELPQSQPLDDYFLRFEGQRIMLPERWHPDLKLLARQRTLFEPLASIGTDFLDELN